MWIPDALCWKIPAFFPWLYEVGDISEQDLVYNFTCGIGAVLIAQKNVALKILAEIQHDEEAWIIGSMFHHHANSPRVQVRHFLEALKLNNFQLLKNVILYKAPAKISKVAILISTKGPKLNLMMDNIRQLGSCARLSLIISNNSAVEELKKAAGAGIPTRVLDHAMFGCRSEFESTMCRALEEFSIDLVCLAGFGRTLSDQFLIGWRVEDVMRRWRSIRDQYRRERQQRARSGSAAPAKKRKYIYYDRLSFLDPSMDLRPTQSNLTERETGSDSEANIDPVGEGQEVAGPSSHASSVLPPATSSVATQDPATSGQETAAPPRKPGGSRKQ
ncbi:trifunctional purine biosynthetic protein adenosine-3-like [Ranitomeya imitator]|uniref:trifunctional purine biosynthetic protein adenosine-3-like n=1 Tax=Ranitomeya imitator TaxID=111125 RepID=UPI0037E81D5F